MTGSLRCVKEKKCKKKANQLAWVANMIKLAWSLATTFPKPSINALVLEVFNVWYEINILYCQE